MPRAVTLGTTTWIGLDIPSSIGPTGRPSAAAFSTLKEMLAASNVGMISRFAAPFSRLSGTARSRIACTRAASACISPSISSPGARTRIIARADASCGPTDCRWRRSWNAKPAPPWA